MPLQYDATVKELVTTYPADWVTLAGRRQHSPVEVIDADISTVSAASDKVLRVLDPTPWLLHIEFQSSTDAGLAERVHWYNALLRHRHKAPVSSLVVLLRPEADSMKLTGL